MVTLYTVNSLKYWLDGPCCLSVTAVGVVSNVAALFVLRRELVQRTFHLLMMFLAVWDAAYLVLSVAWDVFISQVHPDLGEIKIREVFSKLIQIYK